MDRGSIRFKYPVYPSLELLPVDNRAYACWYYYTLAMKLAEQIGDGSIDSQFGILEGERWLDPRYEQIARSVALIYGFKDPGVFMEARFWDVVGKQALELGLPQPIDAIMHPLRIVIN